MRDLINIITESTGIANLKSGDIFKNSDGDEIIFKQLKFFPKSGKYDMPTLNKELSKVKTKYNNITWLNAKTSGIGGFALIEFESDSGPVYFGRFLQNIKPNFTDNFITTNLGNYRYSTNSSTKISSGLTPQDLISGEDLTADDILIQLSDNLGLDHPLFFAIQDFLLLVCLRILQCRASRSSFADPLIPCENEDASSRQLCPRDRTEAPWSRLHDSRVDITNPTHSFP